MDKDLASAKALHQRMQTEGVLADELSLKRLAVLYRTHGETAPFPEPAVSRVHVGGDGPRCSCSLAEGVDLEASNTSRLEKTCTTGLHVHAPVRGASVHVRGSCVGCVV